MKVIRRLFWLLPLFAVVACEPNAPPPASVTVRGVETAGGPAVFATRIRVDGLVEEREWAMPDTVMVLLPDGRDIMVLHQRGPESFDFAFLGLGAAAPEPIYPEVLLDVSGRFPAQFGRDSWWFRIAPRLCWARSSTQDMDCETQLAGFEASPSPRERQDNLEVRIPFSVLSFDPVSTPDLAFALRFSDPNGRLAAIWPLPADLERPDTWSRLDLSR